MNQTLKSRIIVLVLFIGAFILSSGKSLFIHSIAQAQSNNEITGSLLSVDPIEKTVVIKYLKDTLSKEFEAELFNIKEETRILKQGAEVGFSEVKVGVSGKFGFSIDSEGRKNLVSINLN